MFQILHLSQVTLSFLFTQMSPGRRFSLDCDLYLGSSTRSTLARLPPTHVPSGHGSREEAWFRFQPL